MTAEGKLAVDAAPRETPTDQGPVRQRQGCAQCRRTFASEQDRSPRPARQRHEVTKVLRSARTSRNRAESTGWLMHASKTVPDLV